MILGISVEFHDYNFIIILIFLKIWSFRQVFHTFYTAFAYKLFILSV